MSYVGSDADRVKAVMIPASELPITKLAPGTANRLIGFDENGNPVEKLETIVPGSLDYGKITEATDTSSITLGNLTNTDQIARDNIVLNAFRIAIGDGLSVQSMVDGYVDEFEDESGVDLAASTNETYDATDDFYQPSASSNMTLISNSISAEVQPTDAHIVILQEDVDSVTVNTDIKAYASRDGGTTFTQITLTDEGNFDSAKRILSGSVDISGQPAGTSMEYQIETLNTTDQKIHGVALQWS